VKTLLRAFALVATLALAFFAGGFWNATRPPAVVLASLQLPGLPAGTKLSVLLFSDTHFGRPDMPASRLDAIVNQANALKPDLILLAGDYSGGKLIGFEPTVRMEPAVRPFARLKAPLGVWAVNGNHESLKWSAYVFGHQPSPRLLVNSHVDLGPLLLAGAGSSTQIAGYAGMLAALPPGKPVLLLLHEGDALIYLNRPKQLSALALAGHTHGGQVVLPLLGSLGSSFLGAPHCLRGPCNVNGWPLYVTSGVGTSWLPIRYGVPPELVLLTITP
jgi:hypothetical protein